MHPVANEVPVPTDGIERELLVLAEKKFHGRARLTLRVKPEAALSVEVLPPAATETQRIGDRAQNASPELFTSGQPTTRELIVRQFVTANAYRFRLGMKLTAVICDFDHGRLCSAQWETVG
jgi:hypothetical protein